MKDEMLVNVPKVSVCMISYNHAAYIRQAIESVLTQDVDFDLELVIGDDCSQDKTADICEELARSDSRIQLLPSVRNLGVMPNFVRTLQACNGDYIAVCEGDDYWTDRQKLRKQVRFLEANAAFAGATHQSSVIVDGKEIRKFRIGVPEELSVKDLTKGRMFHTASVLFRKPVVDLFSRSPHVLSCDRLLNFCIAFLGKIHYSEEVMCAYRLHGAGMSSNASVAQMKMDLNCISYLRAICESFPKFTYMSYVYATIGLAKSARVYQKVYYLSVSFILSFADFPRNLKFMWSRVAKAHSIDDAGSKT